MLYRTVMRHTAANLMPESWTLSDHLQSMAYDGAVVLNPAMLVFRLAIPVCKCKPAMRSAQPRAQGQAANPGTGECCKNLQSRMSRPEIHQLAAMHTWRCIAIWRLLKA